MPQCRLLLTLQRRGFSKIMNEAAQKELSRKEYWDDRYAEERGKQEHSGQANYEWFKTFEKLRPFLSKHLPDTSCQPRLLHLGCGTSVSAIKTVKPALENNTH